MCTVDIWRKKRINKAIELGTEPEPVEWDMRAVITTMTEYRDADVFPWMGAREILFVVNFKNLHWFTFQVDIEVWTITVFDCHKDLMQTTGNQNDFNEMMEVRKRLFMVITIIRFIYGY